MELGIEFGIPSPRPPSPPPVRGGSESPWWPERVEMGVSRGISSAHFLNQD
jgi:hypothetical protein